jgi:hypothetical protein
MEGSGLSFSAEDKESLQGFFNVVMWLQLSQNGAIHLAGNR